MPLDEITIGVFHREGEAVIRIRRDHDGAFSGKAKGGLTFGPDTGEIALDLDTRWATRLFRDAERSILVPPIAGGLMGMDGTTYHLSLRAGMSEAHFTWWLEAPEPWKALGRLHTRIRRRFVSEGGVGPLDPAVW